MRPLTALEQSRIWMTVPLAGDRRAILLNYPDRDEEHSPDEVNRNLVCVDDQNNVTWQVKPPLPFQPTGDPFVQIKAENGILRATRFFGDICEINPDNGLATIVGWTK
jgi:hypothetical protein